MMETLAGELRLVLRRLRRSPGFTAAAVLTLALGIGANTALFSLADAALLRPLPYPTADRLLMVWETQPGAGKPRERVSAADFLDWRRQARSFDAIAAWDVSGLALTGEGEPEELSSVRVSANMFQLLGATPALGRGFLPEEEITGRDRVVVLSHGFWTGRFGADSGVIGRTLTLDGSPHEIVGVMPEGFRFPDEGAVALWNPLAFHASELTSRAERRFDVIGRLAPGATLADAQAELELIARRLAEAHPETNAGWSAAAMPAAETVAAGGRSAITLLLGTVALVLLLACANVAHLFLARTMDRQRELSVRVALGGGPGRLLELLVLECGVVVVLGALGGVALAVWVVPLVHAMDPGLLPRWRQGAVDGRVLGLTAALLVPVVFACGVLPGLHALRLGGRSVRSGVRLTEGRERGRLWRALIAAEIALAAVPLPMNPIGIDYDLPFSADGSPPPSPAERREVDFRVVAGDYFSALTVPVVRARPLYALDPAQPISDLTTLSDLLRGSVAPERFNLILLGGFAALALLLAAVGVYGIVAYAVSGRTREIGIRMALGAAGREVRRAVMGPALGPSLAGVVLGSAGAVLLGRALGTELYEVGPHDPLTFALVAVVLLGAAAVACAIPARRAARVDPVVALRSE